jgi:hypothetical protein
MVSSTSWRISRTSTAAGPSSSPYSASLTVARAARRAACHAAPPAQPRAAHARAALKEPKRRVGAAKEALG